jgi:hypothetical protein
VSFPKRWEGNVKALSSECQVRNAVQWLRRARLLGSCLAKAKLNPIVEGKFVMTDAKSPDRN